MIVAENILCSKTHEYVMEQNGLYLIGVTDYFINKFGEIVSVEIPETGSTFVKGELFGSIQGVNSSKDLYMPISGTVVEVNEEIVDNYDKLNETSWLIKVESTSANEEIIDLYEYDDYLELV